jgi:hypothetical protein
VVTAGPGEILLFGQCHPSELWQRPRQKALNGLCPARVVSKGMYKSLDSFFCFADHSDTVGSLFSKYLAESEHRRQGRKKYPPPNQDAWGVGNVYTHTHTHTHTHTKLGMVMHVCNPSTQEAEVGGSRS